VIARNRIFTAEFFDRQLTERSYDWFEGAVEQLMVDATEEMAAESRPSPALNNMKAKAWASFIESSPFMPPCPRWSDSTSLEAFRQRSCCCTGHFYGSGAGDCRS
jgi:hypothetical protein